MLSYANHSACDKNTVWITYFLLARLFNVSLCKAHFPL